MRNKGIIVLLTVVVTALCLYYLSFTYVSRGVKAEATAYATDASGTVNFRERDRYLDSMSNEVVYDIGVTNYTFKEVQETELNLGLDLQGGMSVTLEISPIPIIQGLSSNSDDPAFLKALEVANERQKTSQSKFVDLFYEAYQEEAPNTKLSTIFATASNRGRIDFDSDDKAVLDMLNDEVDDAVDRSFNILRTRLDRFGTSQPNIQKLPATGRIQIELPGVDNKGRVLKLLQGVAKLEFWEVYNLPEYSNSLVEINAKLVGEQKMKTTAPSTSVAEATETTVVDGDTTVVEETTETTDLEAQLSGVGTEGDSTGIDSLATPEISPLFSLNRSQYSLVYEVKDTMQINRILEREDIQDMLPANLKFLWEVKANILEDGTELLELVAIKTNRSGKAPLTGEVVTNAYQGLDQRTRPSVFINMNAQGARQWKKLTGENIGRRVAIVLDDYVYSAPNVEVEIPGGSSIISGSFTLEEAQDLANILKAGSLPAPVRVVEAETIGATLGKESQMQGIVSIVAGLLIVVLFVLAYYSKGGMVANIALLFNIFFIIGILAQLGSALTLPGIAGIVLTIGMSIDANVLIFERIREELRSGQSLMKAIELGYDKAFSSIVDANVTTFLTGLILFTVGQGPVKGFAITLMIGIGCSFFTAVFITRVILSWMTKKGNDSKVSFAVGWSKNFLTNTNIDFLSKRRNAYIGSAIFILIGMSIVFTKGMNMGVDFSGGRSYVVRFDEAIPTNELKSGLLDHFEGSGTEVKTYGATNVLKVTTNYLVEEESTEADEKVEAALKAGVFEITGQTYILDDAKVDAEHFSISSWSKVSPTIASDIKTASTEAAVVSLIVIFLYILIRFRKWQFGLGALVALAHDTLFVISAFAIAELLGFTYEVDQVFVAALLTIIGYSINDTVVVFDRIRETFDLRSHADYKTNINLSINSTLSRTIITSMTTLVVILVLFLFGGEVLKGFSFALMVGVVIGTYSSIFIATPVVVDLTEKRPKKK